MVTGLILVEFRVLTGACFNQYCCSVKKPLQDGPTFNKEVRGSTFEYKSELHILTVIRDITERKLAETA